MNDWHSYRLEDFIPFSPEIYWRLIERINEAWWPLHLITVALGLVALVLALRGNTRFALVLLAPAWLTSGIIFHLSYYAELNWAAGWFSWAFIVQAALLLSMAAFGAKGRADPRPRKAISGIGTAIAILALLAYPLIAAILGGGVAHAEAYGLHPDPTAIATLGVLLIARRGPAAWLAVPIPLVWCLIATLTLIPLDATWAFLPLAMGLVAVGALATATWARTGDG